MWYLQWTSGKFEHDSNEHTHKRELNLTDFNQKKAAKLAALRGWEAIGKSPEYSRELYRDPELVWAEPLIE